MFTFTYGSGQFIHGDTHAEGEIILNEFKLYLRGHDGTELTQTFVPLDKVRRLWLKSNVMTVEVWLSVSIQYHASVTGKTNKIKELTRDLVKQRGLKKKFLKNEWVEDLK